MRSAHRFKPGIHRPRPRSTIADKARMAELADAPSSGGGPSNRVQVRILLRALNPNRTTFHHVAFRFFGFLNDYFRSFISTNPLVPPRIIYHCDFTTMM